MRITNQELYNEIIALSQKIDKINHTMYGNGAIGLIDQVKKNTEHLDVLEKSYHKTLYLATGAVLTVNVLIGLAIKFL